MGLLADNQIHSFVNTGFIKIELPDLELFHKQIDVRLREVCEAEPNLGNNFLPRMPILQRVLRHEKVEGALTSLLGPDYLVHPHRAIHRSTPLRKPLRGFSSSSNEHLMGDGSTATSLWHQDAQSPLAKARYHFPRFLLGFYFPHEVDSLMGPTRFLKASYCDNGPDLDREIYQPERIQAGTLFLAHFDIAHAGFPNASETDRFMLKFVFARTTCPSTPSWNNQSPELPFVEAETSKDLLYRPTAHFIWNKLLGHSHVKLVQEEQAVHDSGECRSSNQRLRSIYDAQRGPSTQDCLESLRSIKDKFKHERVQKNLRDLTAGYPVRWNERAIVMEAAAYRLAALGAQSSDAVFALIESDEPWLQINGAFVAGEIGTENAALSSHLANLLLSPHHQVVRQAIDALSYMETESGVEILQRLNHLILEDRSTWQSAQVTRGWSAADQIHMNIAMYLLAKCNHYEHHKLIETAHLILQKTGDYAASIVTEALIRSGSRHAQDIALSYLKDRAWNTSLLGSMRAY